MNSDINNPGPLTRLRAQIPAHVRLWLKLYLAGLSLFFILRLIFTYSQPESVAESNFEDIARAFLIGVRFDAVILSALFLPLFLVTSVKWFRPERAWPRRIFMFVMIILFTIIAFLGVADLGFFQQFGNHLDYWAVEYLEYPAQFLYTLIFYEWSGVLFIIWLAVTVFFFILVRGTINSTDWKLPLTSPFTGILIYLLCLCLLGISIRGRLGIKPLDWGEAFFSQSHFINQIPLNAAYTLAHSIYEEMDEGRAFFDQEKSRLDFYPVSEATATVREMLEIDDNPVDENRPLFRTSRANQELPFTPNLVFIIMESWSAEYIGALGNSRGLSPCFDSLATHGILFTNFYANGARTNRGIAASLCSFPSLPGRSIMKRYAADYPFRSLADILHEKEGFHATFAYGGDIHFDNMRGFLTGVGFESFYDENSFPGAPRLGKWGVPDHIFLEKMAENISTLRSPFLLSMLTLSFHDPFLIPGDFPPLFGDTIDNYRQYNCFHYSDQALGEFMAKARNYSYFDSTIFVFTADHCFIQSSEYPLSPESFHIPLLIYSPSLLGNSARTVATVGSQVDILPTLLGIIGIKAGHHSWGRNLLDRLPDSAGFAAIVSGDKLGLIEGNYFYLNWVKAQTGLFDLRDKPYLGSNLRDSLPDLAGKMERRLNSYIQLADHLSRGKKTAGD